MRTTAERRERHTGRGQGMIFPRDIIGGDERRLVRTFNGSRSVRSADPSSVLYLQSLSLWSMVE